MEVCDTEQATAELLTVAMDDNPRAAQLLAHAVHQPLHIPPPAEIDQLRQLPFDVAKHGVWIDPIGKELYQYTRTFLLIPESGILHGQKYLQGLKFCRLADLHSNINYL